MKSEVAFKAVQQPAPEPAPVPEPVAEPEPVPEPPVEEPQVSRGNCENPGGENSSTCW